MCSASKTVVVFALKCETYENELSCWIPIIFLMPKLNKTEDEKQRKRQKKKMKKKNQQNVNI